MAKSHLKLVAPTTENRTVAMPTRKPNAELRTREYLTDAEVEQLDRGGQGQPLRPPRRHHDPDGLPSRPPGRASWWTCAGIRSTSTAPPWHVRRVKQGTPSTHPIMGDELRALRRLQREQEPKSPFVFTSERGSPFTTAGFARTGGARWRRRRAGLQGSPPHAAARLRLRPGQQGPRYPGAAGLSRPQEHPAHGALHRAVTRSVQGLLAELMYFLLQSSIIFAVCASNIHWHWTPNGG